MHTYRKLENAETYKLLSVPIIIMTIITLNTFSDFRLSHDKI